MPDVGIVQTLDSNRKLQIDVKVITLKDNLTHPYFSYIEMSKDNSSPVGTARLFAPYDIQIMEYWSKYAETVILSFNLDDLKNSTNSSKFFNLHEDVQQNISNEEYNYSFIAKVHKVKQKGKEIIIYLEDIGWKFLQKVPSDFRNSYIANQSLDNAFQAICEFIGVDFAYSIDDLSQFTFGADGYSIQKEGETIETVETILSKWDTSSEKDGSENEEEERDPLSDAQYENPSLIEFDNEHKNDENYQDKEKTVNIQINDQDENQEKINKYQEEFDKKIQKLFIGNGYYEADISKALLDYGRITITPQTNTDTNTDNTSNNITEDSSNTNQSNSETTSKMSGDIGGNFAVVSKPTNTSHSKKALSQSYINSLSLAKAQELAKQTNIYDTKTIKRLRRRAMGLFW